MKKIIFTLIALCCALSMDAQILKVMKNGEVIMTLKASEADEFVFEEEPIVKVTGITLNRSAFTLGRTTRFTLTATITPDDATNKNIIWTSSDPKVATVSNTGVVTATDTGITTITATAADGSGVSATCTVGSFYDRTGEYGGYDVEIELRKFRDDEPHEFISIQKELAIALANDKMTRENQPFYVIIYEKNDGNGSSREYKYVASNGKEGTAEDISEILDIFIDDFREYDISPSKISFMYPVKVDR